MLPRLARQALGEFVGSVGLVCAVVGSGIAAERLSKGDVGLQLLENSFATALALVALVLAFSSVSGAHFNPVVTAVEWARRAMPGRDAAAFVGAQIAGCAVGALLANAMFERPVFEFSTHVRTGTHLWLGEVVATIGLLVTIHGTLASNAKAVPFAVGAYIGAAYWFTSSTSFANPAVTLARALTDSFAGIAPSSVSAFVVAQAIGAGIGFAVIALLLPGWVARTSGRRNRGRPQLLFVCVRNAGRSQMAAAFAAAMGGDRVEVLSAGSQPGDAIHSNAYDAMKEIGIDLKDSYPKSLSEEFVRASDAVITMGCGDTCPVFPGKRYEDWDVQDPAGQPMTNVRAIRDDIKARVRTLLEELGVEIKGRW